MTLLGSTKERGKHLGLPFLVFSVTTTMPTPTELIREQVARELQGSVTIVGKNLENARISRGAATAVAVAVFQEQAYYQSNKKLASRLLQSRQFFILGY